jgi:hypothetical protein
VSDNSDIHPKNRTLGMTWPERLAVAPLFVPAAMAVTASLLAAPEKLSFAFQLTACEILIASPFILYHLGRALLPRARKIAATLARKKSPPPPSPVPLAKGWGRNPELRHKVAILQRELKRMEALLPPQKTPFKLRVTETVRGPFMNLSTNVVYFPIAKLKWLSTSELIGCLGHEMAHAVIGQKGGKALPVFAAASTLALCTAGLALLPISPAQATGPLFLGNAFLPTAAYFYASRYMSRRVEARADRMGAVLAKGGQGLVTLFTRVKAASEKSWEQMLKSFGVEAPLQKKLTIQEALRSLTQTHPNFERRIVRLKALDQKPSLARLCRDDIALLPPLPLFRGLQRKDATTSVRSAP